MARLMSGSLPSGGAQKTMGLLVNKTNRISGPRLVIENCKVAAAEARSSRYPISHLSRYQHPPLRNRDSDSASRPVIGVTQGRSAAAAPTVRTMSKVWNDIEPQQQPETLPTTSVLTKLSGRGWKGHATDGSCELRVFGHDDGRKNVLTKSRC